MNPQANKTPSKEIALAQVLRSAPPSEAQLQWTRAMLPDEVRLQLERGEGLLEDDQPEAAEALYRSLVEKFSAEYGPDCRPTWKAKEGLASSLRKRNAAGANPANLREAAAVYEDLLSSCRSMAEMGDPTGQCYYGYLHVVGLGVGKSYAVAKRYYELSAAQGYALAFSNLAGLHADGLGTPVDRSKASELYDKAIEAGYVPALAYKSLLQEDQSSKIALLTRGVELGDTTAAFWLANLHDRRIQMYKRLMGPRGVSSDTVAEARRLYELVASKPGMDQADAQAKLRQYEEGLPGPSPARATEGVLDRAMSLYQDRYTSLLQDTRGGLF